MPPQRDPKYGVFSDTRKWQETSDILKLRALVGKIDFLLSKNCVFYRIAIERGAQYKVYGTLFNILRQVLLIRHPRAACRFSEHIRPREASEASRSTALLTTSTPLLLPHMYVYSSPST